MPIGIYGGVNTYLYGNADPLFYMDPYGLLGWADMPTLPQDWVDFGAGMVMSFCSDKAKHCAIGSALMVASIDVPALMARVNGPGLRPVWQLV